MFSEVGLHSHLSSVEEIPTILVMVTVIHSVCNGIKTGVMSMGEIFGFMGKKTGQKSCKEFLVSLEKAEGEKKKVRSHLCWDLCAMQSALN